MCQIVSLLIEVFRGKCDREAPGSKSSTKVHLSFQRWPHQSRSPLVVRSSPDSQRTSCVNQELLCPPEAFISPHIHWHLSSLNPLKIHQIP